MCCDCIDVIEPANDLVLDIFRPNCPLHDYYDITNKGVFPDAKYQNYTTGEIIGDKIAPDLEIWLKCKESGRVKMREGQGSAGYFTDSPCEPALVPEPIIEPEEEPDSGRKLLADMDLNEAQTRALEFAMDKIERNGRQGRQLTQDCNSQATKDAIDRTYDNMARLADWVGCAKKSGFDACHLMEYRQGRVCGTQCGIADDCVGKNW